SCFPSVRHDLFCFWDVNGVSKLVPHLARTQKGRMEKTRTSDAGMKEQTVRGAFWIFIDAAGGQIVSLLAFLVLARLLGPRDYGVITLSLSILAIPSILLYEGFGDALIQREDLHDAHINAAFW